MQLFFEGGGGGGGGIRHVRTVPVKLIIAHNDSHAKHVDQKFCVSTKHLEEISSTLGPNALLVNMTKLEYTN